MIRLARPADLGLCAVLSCFLLSTTAIAEPPAEPISEEEQLLIGALDDIRGERLDSALETLEALLAKHPNFRLAQMVYADTLLAKVSPITPFGAPLESHTGVVDALKDEAMKRFSHHRDTPSVNQLPEQLLELSSTLPEVVVDLSASRFYLFENHARGLQLVNDYYVSTGKKGAKKSREGDQKTPVGVYFVTGRIPPSELPDFYGTGALPVNYPNEWDVRNGRTGYGIWIHGVPSSTYARAPRASDGCMALANEIWRPSGESWPREGCRLSLPRTLTGQAAIWSSGVAAKSAIKSRPGSAPGKVWTRRVTPSSIPRIFEPRPRVCVPGCSTRRGSTPRSSLLTSI